MIHARRTTAIIGGLLTTGALVMSTPGLADAAAGNRVTSDSERTVTDGDGDADARANANRQGRFSVFGDVDGGGGDVITGNPDTTAAARAELTKSASAAEGTYRVTVKYRGAKGTDRDRNEGDADVDLRANVTFDGPGAGDAPTLSRTTELTGARRNRVEVFTYRVPDQDSGRLIVNAALRGTAAAPSDNDSARFNGSVRGVVIKVKRIGD